MAVGGSKEGIFSRSCQLEGNKIGKRRRAVCILSKGTKEWVCFTYFQMKERNGDVITPGREKGKRAVLLFAILKEIGRRQRRMAQKKGKRGNDVELWVQERE